MNPMGQAGQAGHPGNPGHGGREGDVEKAILAEMAKPGSPLIERVTLNNQIILHNYRKSVEKNCDCQLLGCRAAFAITLIPNQVLYPKYCTEHRSEFRRRNFLRQLAGGAAEYRFENVRVVAAGQSASG
jgi:hypothetical protein